jgi:hypothetical protein
MRSITCDECAARLDEKPSHIAVENRRMPIGRMIEDAPRQLLEREFHFCSLLCMGFWYDKLGPKGPLGPS